MKSDVETRIPLETFLLHFIRTNLKGSANEVLERLQEQAHRSSEPFCKVMEDWMKSSPYSQSGFRDDAWYAGEISLDNCYFAHKDVHCLFSVPKDHTFVEFMRDKREAIDEGTFPLSAKIRAPWHEVPEPLVQERGDERFYILDGQLRVIRHWYHAITKVKVFIYRGKLEV
jgi:hypothetical protein